MTKRLKVLPLNLDIPQSYDALVATVGFEARATYVARRLNGHVNEVWAFDYHQNHVHSYDLNREYFASHRILSEADSAYRKTLSYLVAEARALQPKDATTGERAIPRIAVDISCMDRDRLARTVMAVTIDQTEPLHVDFLYSFGEFDENLVGSEGTVLVNRPVEGLEGWPTDPDAGLTCLLGLGFESRLALAAIETLEPSQTIALMPRGEDSRYDEVVRLRNSDLLSSDAIAASHDYRVPDLLQTVLDLDASVSALTRRGRVVIVPLGPKTFALAAVLVAIAHAENVTVWRLSADDGRHPEDRLESGLLVGITVEIQGEDEPL